MKLLVGPFTAKCFHASSFANCEALLFRPSQGAAATFQKECLPTGKNKEDIMMHFWWHLRLAYRASQKRCPSRTWRSQWWKKARKGLKASLKGLERLGGGGSIWGLLGPIWTVFRFIHVVPRTLLGLTAAKRKEKPFFWCVACLDHFLQTYGILSQTFGNTDWLTWYMG